MRAAIMPACPRSLSLTLQDLTQVTGAAGNRPTVGLSGVGCCRIALGVTVIVFGPESGGSSLTWGGNSYW